MKKAIYLILCTALFSSVATAQTEEKKETNNRIDKQVQEKWDAGAKKVMEGLLNRGEEVNYEDNYSFDVALLYHIDVFKKNGKKKDESEMEFLINKDNKVFAVIPVMEDEKQKNVMVYDSQNKSVLTLITDKDNGKTGMAMKYDPSEVELETENDFSFEKTDERKNILGYTCQKYIGTDGDIQTEYWITDEVELNMQEVFGAMNQSKTNRNSSFQGEYPKGMVMESTSTEKNGTSTTMKIVELDLDSDKKVSTEGYQIFDLGLEG